MSLLLSLILCCLILIQHLSCVSDTSVPAVSFNVLDYGAVGDSTTDNTQAFKNTIDAAEKQGGGIVLAPTGRYLFKGQLTIPPGVSLIGTFLTVPSHTLPPSAPKDGTVLMPQYGRGLTNYTHSFITIQQDASIKGFVIYYPDQPCQNKEPEPYPPSIYMNGNNAACQDIELLNSYIGIWAVLAHRHYIARIQGQPIFIGVYIDQTYDIGRMEDVHFNPWFCKEIDYLNTQMIYGEAFVLGRSDWEYVFNTFAFGYAVGYHFVETPSGSMNGNFLGIGADYACNASVVVDQSKPNGIKITNGEFTRLHTDQFAPNSTAISTDVVINKDNTGAVIFNSCSFWGTHVQHIARIYGQGTTTFQGCTFVNWNKQNPAEDAAAIYANNGKLIIDGCQFEQNGTTIELDKGAQKAIISNNILNGAMNSKIDPSVKVALSNNL